MEQRRAGSRRDIGITRRIAPGDGAFQRGFVQDRGVGIGIPRNEDWQSAALEGLAVEIGDALVVQGQAGGLQVQVRQCGRAACRDQHAVEILMLAPPCQPDAFLVP